jgi:hypothetical protein
VNNFLRAKFRTQLGYYLVLFGIVFNCFPPHNTHSIGGRNTHREWSAGRHKSLLLDAGRKNLNPCKNSTSRSFYLTKSFNIAVFWLHSRALARISVQQGVRLKSLSDAPHFWTERKMNRCKRNKSRRGWRAIHAPSILSALHSEDPLIWFICRHKW